MEWERIAGWLVEDGWPVDRLGANTLRSWIRGETRSFPLFVHLEKRFLVIAVLPYLKLPVDLDRADALMRRMLHLNREMNLAKLSVDEEADVVLSVEWRASELDRSELRDALDVVSFYATSLWDELAAFSD